MELCAWKTHNAAPLTPHRLMTNKQDEIICLAFSAAFFCIYCLIFGEPLVSAEWPMPLLLISLCVAAQRLAHAAVLGNLLQKRSHLLSHHTM